MDAHKNEKQYNDANSDGRLSAMIHGECSLYRRISLQWSFSSGKLRLTESPVIMHNDTSIPIVDMRYMERRPALSTSIAPAHVHIVYQMLIPPFVAAT